MTEQPYQLLPPLSDDERQARRVAPGDIGDEAYGAGYWEGWWDIHISTTKRRKRKRLRSTEYATGYRDGRIDGASHPYCPAWGRAHRVAPTRLLPDTCPWRLAAARLTPGWTPVSPGVFSAENVVVSAKAIQSAKAALAPALGDQVRLGTLPR